MRESLRGEEAELESAEENMSTGAEYMCLSERVKDCSHSLAVRVSKQVPRVILP